MDMDIVGFMAPGVLAVLIVRYLYGRRQRRVRPAIRLAQEPRRQELLHRLTFFLSSLRHIYNKYPADVLPPALQTERQVFLEKDFRNLTTLSAFSLAELEDLFADVERECATGKWRGGIAAVEQRVEDAARQAKLQRENDVTEADPSAARHPRDRRGGNHPEAR
jgi:hypothetical protein